MAGGPARPHPRPGRTPWLATTTRRECSRALRARGSHAVVLVLDAENIPGQQPALAEQQLLTAERHAALQEALTRLPTSCQQLIAMLIDDPRCPTQGSARS